MQTIGRYVIESRIGSGGLGVIYRARDPQLARDVAIKVMAGPARDAELLARFEREARIAAALAHRNIVTIHEFGIHDGDPFIVMELLGGADLDDSLRSMTVRQRLSVATQVAEALAFAHGRGVVHRDLKPSNIRVLDDGTVKLMDFGIAYVPASTLTKTGELFGTLAFLAPEQLRGSKGDPRSDIYSLGVVMFEMFEGRLPSEGEAVWLARHPELHAIVARALEADPNRRWQSARELLDALNEVEGGVWASGPPPAQRQAEGPHYTDDTAMIFTPGAIIGGRYRVVALLGSGGMGEIYRADDLRLGQRVALKFLAPHLAADPARLERLYAEVRVGRQVSHPNVCRIYDIGDAGGHPFIAMQFVEGEDLASLLRRVGQLSLEKSLDIARDICSGLSAAHAAGVIHRDLKPSNIMIDAQGRAILLDFGLATVGEDASAGHSGTVQYAAPEQLAGRGVSVASDLYSLGLVLYELLTSRPASASERITAPSLARPDIPLALDRIIVRCLSLDPADRPASAREILAVLPGGDAVSAAIAAGETPSPEVIAAAGESGELTPRQAWSALIVIALLAVIHALLTPSIYLHELAPLDDPPAVLASKARAIAIAAGFPATGEAAYEAKANEPYLDWLRETRPDGWRTILRSSPPGAVHLTWSRGEALEVTVDSSARLVRFVAKPPDTAHAEGPSSPARLRMTLEALRDATGCSQFVETAPEWTPPVPSDARRAWRCRANGFDLRVEAASFAGRPAWLEVIEPWRTPKPDAPRRDVTAVAGTTAS